MDSSGFLDVLERLKMAPAGEAGKRHPHKPLLLLWLLARQQQGRTGHVIYEEAQEPVDRLLAEFGTPAKRSKDRAAMPFFHLESELWERSAATADVELSDSGSRLRKASAFGRLVPEVEEMLQRDPELIADAAQLLLEEHFTDTHVDLICGELGLELDGARSLVATIVRRRRRDPRFRLTVLQAYGYVCAMCGWDGRVTQQAVGLAAAHVRWHGHEGPDTVDNGLSLCDLHHKLLDLGVVGLTADRHIVVGADFVADSEVGPGWATTLTVDPSSRHSRGSLRRQMSTSADTRHRCFAALPDLTCSVVHDRQQVGALKATRRSRWCPSKGAS